MMKLKQLICFGAAMVLTSTGANAAVINMIDQGGVAGTPAERGLKIAALYWGSVLTNDVTINLGVFLSPYVIGGADVVRRDYSARDWERQIASTRSGSTLDQTAILPTLNAQGGATFITNDTATDGNVDTTKLTVVPGNTESSRILSVNTAVLKAIGAIGANDPVIDSVLSFNSGSDFFDFDPADGIDIYLADFLTVAIHEIGHALGFVSGVDTLDEHGYPNGSFLGNPGYGLSETPTFSALDMFRYSKDPSNVAGGQPMLDLSVATASYFSIDGGKTAVFGSADFSTGAANGDGAYPSHWRETIGSFEAACENPLGIMDPIACQGNVGHVTALDLAAFDAMGWNISFDVLKNPGYRASTADIYRQFLSAVPEPTTWAMMLAGFAMIGGALRGRRAGTEIRVRSVG